MFLLLVIGLVVTFVAAMGAVVLISIGRAASLGDDPAMELILARKPARRSASSRVRV